MFFETSHANGENDTLLDPEREETANSINVILAQSPAISNEMNPTIANTFSADSPALL